MDAFTLIVPYYRNPLMLGEQLRHWKNYPREVRLIVVDDGSHEPALDVVRAHKLSLRRRVDVYRIDVDIPWNRGGARNLGAKLAETPWIVHIDVDHVLPADAAAALLDFHPSPKRWYRFERFRKGKADETRRKDALAPDVEFGPIKPHIDSYLCTRRMFWEAGGYDEDYSGCLGGGSPFLRNMELIAAPQMAPSAVHLHVYTRSTIADSSEHSLSREPGEYSRRRKAKEINGPVKGENPMRFPWHREEPLYPPVTGEVETVQEVLKGKSIARFGDGELKLLEGRSYRRQPEPHPKLTAELRHVASKPHRDCLIAIPTMDPRGPKYQNWQKHKTRFLRYFNEDTGIPYYSATITRPDSAPWIESREYFELLREIWIRRKRIVIVSEIHSEILTVIAATNEVTHIECPTYRAFDEIDRFEREIMNSSADLAILSCGVAATCLANRISSHGLQAVDLGSVGGFLARWHSGKGAGDDAELDETS